MTRHTIFVLLLFVFVPCFVSSAEPQQGAETLNRLRGHYVVWDSPSKDHSGSMPLGNGDIGLNVWMEPSGDIVFYISKTDSWGDNSRLLKVGKVRVGLSPNPLAEGAAFKQTLILETGDVVVEIGGGEDAAGASIRTVIRVWVDAHHPVIHVTVDSPKKIAATARIELWRTARVELPSIETSDIHLDRSKPDKMRAPTIVEPDTVLKNQRGRIGWYHHNAKSVGPELTMSIQDLTGHEVADPILNRTFGAVIKARDGKRVDDLTLTAAPDTSQRIDVTVLTKHPSSPNEWLAAMDGAIEEIESVPCAQRRSEHERWWREFWGRSWILASQQSGGTPSLMEPGKHPVRLGVNQTGGGRFEGEIARVSLFARALIDEEIGMLSVGGGKDALDGRPQLLGCWTDVEAGRNLDAMNEVDRHGALTLEAWVKPGPLGSGGARIIDKMTPGGSDGFLLDTWPGNSLRLITATGTLSQKNVLTPDEWHHVVAVIDSSRGRQALYHNGKQVAEQTVSTENDAFVVSRAYALQRFITACAGRGRYPIKFNGTIFTVPNSGSPGDADYRRWGPGYWWQNTRLPYISMCASGDFEMMRPMFRMYAGEIFDLCKYRTNHYFGFDGAYYPECVYFWGACFTESYGWTPASEREDKLQASGWHKWEWVCGPELVCLMLDHYEHTGDEELLREKTLPVAKAVARFFEGFYKTNADGKLVMHPSQAVETWWDCTNPMPEVAGLRAMSRRILELPEDILDQREVSYWQALKQELPEIPTCERSGLRMLAPAEEFDNKRNSENPELYAVYPFRQIAIGKPDIELGLNALEHRWNKGASGWRQDDIFMAYLGLTDQARTNLSSRARNYHKGSRFPAFWGPNYDWVPDQDHGGVLMKAFQSMLMQTDGRSIHLLPAWPKDWDVDFKLHAPYRTVIEGEYRDGELKRLEVTPESRRKDIVLPSD